MKDRTKKSCEQLDLGLGSDKPTGPERTLKVRCANYGAKSVAYYGYDKESLETAEVNSCDLCHGDECKRGTSKARRSSSWPR
jgi:hypothetical protein